MLLSHSIASIGPVFMNTLATSNIRTIDDLAQANVDRLQLLLGKSQLQCKKIVQEARRFPRFNVSVKEVEFRVLPSRGVESTIEILVELRHTKAEIKRLLIKDADSKAYHLAALITTTDVLVCFKRILGDDDCAHSFT